MIERMSVVQIRTNHVIAAVFFGIMIFLTIWGWRFLNTSSDLEGSLSLGSKVNMKELLSASIFVARLGGKAVKEIREKGTLHEQVKGKTKEGAKELKSDGDMASHRIMYYGLKRGFPLINVESEEHDSVAPDAKDIIDVEKHLSDVSGIPDDIFVDSSDINVWIDPLDATQEYTEDLRQYVTTMVCVAVKGQPTIGVIHKAFGGRTSWAFAGHGHSKDLDQHKKNTGASTSLIVSRSHAGEVESVAKEAFGQNTVVVPAGGAGYKTLEVISGNVSAYVHVTAIKKWDICAGNALLRELHGQQTTLLGRNIDYSATGSPANTDGLLVTLHDHERYLQALQPIFKAMQQKDSAGRHKRVAPAVNHRLADRTAR